MQGGKLTDPYLNWYLTNPNPVKRCAVISPEEIRVKLKFLSASKKCPPKSSAYNLSTDFSKPN
jgi:hypothetical protein